MAFPQLINFRGTVGYVTDGANTFAEVMSSFPAGDYPTTTAQGNTVGWEQEPVNNLNRDNTIDVRLAGINYAGPVQAGGCDFRIDLPATGTYNVNAAFGDAGAGEGNFTVKFKDSTTVLSTPVNDTATPASLNWFDATGVLRTSAADWVNNNAAQALTFATTIFRTNMNGDVIAAGNAPIAHIAIASGGAAAPIFRRTLSQFGTRAGSRPVHFG